MLWCCEDAHDVDEGSSLDRGDGDDGNDYIDEEWWICVVWTVTQICVFGIVSFEIMILTRKG